MRYIGVGHKTSPVYWVTFLERETMKDETESERERMNDGSIDICKT